MRSLPYYVGGHLSCLSKWFHVGNERGKKNSNPIIMHELISFIHKTRKNDNVHPTSITLNKSPFLKSCTCSVRNLKPINKICLMRCAMCVKCTPWNHISKEKMMWYYKVGAIGNTVLTVLAWFWTTMPAPLIEQWNISIWPPQPMRATLKMSHMACQSKSPLCGHFQTSGPHSILPCRVFWLCTGCH